MKATSRSISDDYSGLNRLGLIHRSRRVALATILAFCAGIMAGPSANAGDHSRPMGGTCNTTFEFTGVGTAEYIGTCNLLHLGLTHVFATQIIIANPDGTLLITQLANYTAANGDMLSASFVGIGTFTSPTSVSFSGTETYIGGNGRFANASGNATLDGSAQFTSATGGVGNYTGRGAISY